MNYSMTLLNTNRAQDKRGLQGELRDIFSYFSVKKCCNPSLQLSPRYGSSGVFFMKKYGNYFFNHPCYSFLTGPSASIKQHL